MIELERVTKRFGGKIAVKDLSLRLKPGELFAFLGPNGAGKTTTIKLITGLLRPTSGRIRVGGFDVSAQYLSAKRLMAYIPDEPYLYDKLSGSEFLHFIADLYGIRGKRRDLAIGGYVELFAMMDYIDNLIESYSYGMRQRLVISAALLHDPKIIVVDEPLIGLDPQTSRLVCEVFRAEVKKGKTIFMSTHLLSIAEQTADRIGIINDGELIAMGTQDELRAKCQTQDRLEEIFFKIVDTQPR
jgi:ABC-2 type transport system ATP-binding protein